MGLDLVELVLYTEETFGIQIDDAEASQIHTPGELADYVAARILRGEGGAAPCLSQTRFYRLRSVLMEILDAPREKIRPKTPLAELMQADHRLPERWKRLSAALTISRFPFPLSRPELPPALQAGVMAVNGGAPLLFLCCALAARWSFPQTLVPLFLLWIGTLFLTDRLTRQKRTRLPRKFATVAALLPHVHIPPASPAWTRAAILGELIRMTSAQSGVPVDEIREDTRFVEDLGMS
jgi:acyl carrier protein